MLPQIKDLTSLLTEAEFSELSLRRHRERSLLSRALLKKFLSERLKTTHLNVGKTENGKLFLENHSYYFNLAHSGDWMAFVFHSTKSVGVDIETWDRSEQILRFAPRYFKPKELAYLEKEPKLSKERALQIWTCKEAWLKAEGSTVFAALEHREIPFTLKGEIDTQKIKFEHQSLRDFYFLTTATTNG